MKKRNFTTRQWAALALIARGGVQMPMLPEDEKTLCKADMVTKTSNKPYRIFERFERYAVTADGIEALKAAKLLR